MLNKAFLVDYLRRSLQLDNPSIKKDPSYIYSDEDLWTIIVLENIKENPDGEEEVITKDYLPLVINRSKREIYYRLATSTAPFYPIKAEGAELYKNKRFDHYMKLIKYLAEEYESLKKEKNACGKINSIPVLIDKFYYTDRNYLLANNPIVKITEKNVYTNSVELGWSRFITKPSGLFNCYKVYISTSIIYDTFLEKIQDGVEPCLVVYDIHNTKVRIDNLLANTEYQVVVESVDRNNLSGFATLQFKTKELEY